MTTARAYDWTGSASDRRPQGVCHPPASDLQPTTCEFVPARTPVLTRRISGGKWQQHKTRERIRIDETLNRTDKRIVFAHMGWVIAVSLKHIQKGTING